MQIELKQLQRQLYHVHLCNIKKNVSISYVIVMRDGVIEQTEHQRNLRA